jgi:adenine-specific DNA-methyltransferase
MDGKSRNLTEDYIQQIKSLFPEAVTEVADNEGNNITHKIDMEKLAILLGEAAIPTDETEYRQKYGEKFSFEWAGKRRAIAEAQKRSTGTLRPCPEESVDWDTTENLYIEGDNLEVLKLLQDSYIGAVKMIYIDPPYNTGKDFVYKDNYKDNLANYLEQTNTTNAVNSEASGRYHTNWLNMMYPRLKLARNLLTDDGVIFISIDDNEVSNLKSICDEVFGEDNFVAQLIWERAYSPKNDAKFISNSHDYILMYTKQINEFKIGRLERTEEANARYLNPDNDPRGIWKPSDLSVKTYNEACDYPITTPSGKIVEPPAGRCWSLSRNAFLERLQDNRIWFGPNGDSVPCMKRFLSELKFDGMAPTSILFYKEVGHSQEGAQEVIKLLEAGIFDGPKPVRLLRRLLRLANTNKDSIILDFFSGSATTAHAVMQLNSEDGGNRKYICVQIPEPTPDNSEAQKAGYNTIPEIAKERIRRAGKKIQEEQKAKNDGLFADEAPKLDIGFKVFKLDRSNVKEWDVELEGLNEQQAALQLQAEFDKTLDILKDGRTELDILYEVMLKLGLLLTTHVKEVDIEGKKAFVVGDGVMVASFAKGLTYAQVGKILDLKASFVQAGEFKVVFADESFASDNDKTNAMQLFKQRGITNYEII